MTSHRAPNIPLLRKAVEWAEAEAAKPDQRLSEWYQGITVGQVDDRCGTCFCIAGYVRSLYQGADPEQWRGGPTMEYAADKLGIGREHAKWDGLFGADKSIDDVRRIAESIAAAAGERL